MHPISNVAPYTSDPITVRIHEAVRLTGISRSVLYELIRSGQLETVKVGRTTLVLYAALRALVTKSS